MRDLPPAARIYVSAVLLLAAVVGGASLVLYPPRLQMAPVALVLLVAATVAQQFNVKSPKHQSYYTTTIFFVTAALLLRPGYVILIIVTAHLLEQVRERYRWYIQAFNIANFTLSALAAGAVFRVSVPGSFQDPSIALRAGEAGLVFVLLNHVMTVLVIFWARRVPIAQAGTLSLDNLGTDLALTWIGALGALLWTIDPWLAPLCLGPLFLVYRSLLVPNLQEEARTDPKTSLFNMKHWNQVAAAEIERAARFRRPLSVVLADLDLLREVNNRNGHLVGDQLIRRVAEAIRLALRDYDLPARFGGDEFAILMPETTEAEAAMVAERVRRGVEAMDFRVDGACVAITASIGVASFPKHGRTPAELLAAADRAVYQAKALGRNRVQTFGAVAADPLRPIALVGSST